MRALEIDHSSPETPIGGYDAGLAPLRARLMRHARLLVSDHDVAEDLVQDTLLAVLHGHASMRGEASLATWAVAILKHKVADWHRSPSRRLMTHFAVDGDGGDGFDCEGGDGFNDIGAPRAFGAQAEPFAQPDRALEERELYRAVERCTARFSAQSRQVFAMREQLGFETDEVCLRLGISQEHCRVLLHRARTTLRAFLRDGFVEPGGKPDREASARRANGTENSRYVSRPGNDRLIDCTT